MSPTARERIFLNLLAEYFQFILETVRDIILTSRNKLRLVFTFMLFDSNTSQLRTTGPLEEVLSSSVNGLVDPPQPSPPRRGLVMKMHSHPTAPNNLPTTPYNSPLVNSRHNSIPKFTLPHKRPFIRFIIR